MMTPQTGPSVRGAVVVVAYASGALLERTLVPLRAAGSSGTPFEVVVVDNHSTDAERAAVIALAGAHGWHLVPRRNDGFGAGMQAGVERSRTLGCDAVVLLNPDVSADKETLEALLDHARREPDALLTPRVTHPDGTPAFAEGTLDLRRGLIRTQPPLDPALERWLSGACIALSTRLWDATGGLATEYFMYWEDLELSHRVLRAGGRLVVRPDLAVAHDVGRTQARATDTRTALAPKSSLYRYLNTRNRLLFARRNLPRRAALRWLGHSAAYARQVLLRDGRRAVLRRPTSVWDVVRGTLAGVRMVLIGR